MIIGFNDVCNLSNTEIAVYKFTVLKNWKTPGKNYVFSGVIRGYTIGTLARNG